MEGSRRHVRLAIVPLAVMAVGLVAAVLVPYGSPLNWMMVTTPEPSSPFNVIYLGAGVLGVSIVLGVRRDAAPGVVAMVFAVIAILGATILTGIAVTLFAEGGYWTPALVFAAPVAVAITLAFNALRMRGWDRTLWMLGAFAVAALPFSCPLIPGMFNLFSGGVVYLVADVTLLALFLRGASSVRVASSTLST